jgi:hypothetical protein
LQYPTPCKHTSITYRIEKSQDKFFNNLKITKDTYPLFLKCVSEVIYFGVDLLSKGAKKFTFDEYVAKISLMIDQVEQFYANSEDSNHKLETLEKQRDYIMFVIGICKGDFEMIGVLANKLGFFEKDIVKSLFRIFVRYKKTTQIWMIKHSFNSNCIRKI